MTALETLAARRDPAHPQHHVLALRRKLYQSVVDYLRPEQVINLGCGYECPYYGKVFTRFGDTDREVIRSYLGKDNPIDNHWFSHHPATHPMYADRMKIQNTLVLCEGLFAYLSFDDCVAIIRTALDRWATVMFEWSSPEDLAAIGSTAIMKPYLSKLAESVGLNNFKDLFLFWMPNETAIVCWIPR